MTRTPSRGEKRPTWTTLILQALVAADDFATAAQLCEATGANIGQCTAALHHLRNRHAVDCVPVEGQLFWFATPGDDDRERVVEERRPEEPGTRRRRGNARKTVKPADKAE